MNTKEMWAAAVHKNARMPMNWQLAADDFAKAVIDQCIEIVKPSQYHEAYPDNYVLGQEGLDLLNYKAAQLKLLK
jgi:hypothetical protein